MYILYMDGVVREVNVRVLGKGLELLRENCGRFEINQLLFADDTALVVDSEEKFCPYPARQPLMPVNNQKSGHLGQGFAKD